MLAPWRLHCKILYQDNQIRTRIDFSDPPISAERRLMTRVTSLRLRGTERGNHNLLLLVSLCCLGPRFYSGTTAVRTDIKQDGCGISLRSFGGSKPATAISVHTATYYIGRRV